MKPEHPPAVEKESLGPRSLMRLLGLFDALAASSDGMTLAELNVALDTPKSSLLNLLRPLVLEAYLMHDGTRYRLGPAIFRMSANVMAAWNVAKVLRPFMVELSSACKETVYLGVLDVEEKVVTYVEVLESAQSVRYSMTVGQRRPLYCTAAGRVLLAHAPATFLDTYLDTVELAALTPRTKSTREALLAELAQIRKTGIAVSKGELVSESAGMSVPVRSPDGTVIAAMAIGAPLERFEANIDRLREILLGVARRVSGLAVPR
ncbi:MULTISPECIES: IclR family transcriptional regulator [Herbaspirillum]|uniref:IclR family transcriptional regulator n=2 Tax=Herbaspirillum rubrisubalbicans TaxID=80842 RepID=A0A6M3ZSC8_9BURK|nr:MULTISPECIES: IclR family transcriptional regulator [Herbaspirillum]QJQ01529.1 IclR family transcriptional regulator [Herbaspirillum rubrisubalbicans Os34]